MKFRFLGGMDCPDWLLAQITSSSKLSAIKYRGLCNLAVENIMNSQIEDTLYQKYITEDLDTSELKRILMSVVFILKKSSGYLCLSEDLENELIQLGLPPEHSKMITRVFAANSEQIKSKFLESLPKGKHITMMPYDKTEAHFEIKTINTSDDALFLSGKQGEKNLTLQFNKQLFQNFNFEMLEIERILNETATL